MDSGLRENTLQHSSNQRIIPQIRYSPGLPILDHKERILSLLRSNQVIIVAGQTGSGKTTQLPIMCLEADRGRLGKIGCTQPRRIAATSVAHRVARELHTAIGSAVGYKIRFNDVDSPAGCIKFMTDGILLAEISHDRFLRQYDTLIIDEAHERSLNIDFLLGYIRTILPQRPDLRLIISSATIDTRLFSDAFGHAPVVEVSGRLFPIDVEYYPLDENDEDYVSAAAAAVQDIVGYDDTGDVLVFMPTERDILETIDVLESKTLYSAELLSLFGRLTNSEQQRIFSTHGKRKVIVATNIAETSLTVPGIRFVVDTGFARVKRYLPRTRTTSLPVEPISQASANQRMGRCGRVQGGICIRLFSKEDLNSRPLFTTPEIKRSNLADVILRMTVHNLGPIEEFPFLEPPLPKSISEGYKTLVELGALDEQRILTPLGRKMADFPLDPPMARMVIQASHEHALTEIAIIVSGMSVVDPRLFPLDEKEKAVAAHKRFIDPMSDFLGYLKMWELYRTERQSLKSNSSLRRFCKSQYLSYNRFKEWADVYEQILGIIKRHRELRINSNPASFEAIHKSLLSGLLSNVAIKTEQGTYRSARSGEIAIFPGSGLYKKGAPWIMYGQQVETSRLFARTVAALDPAWLEQVAPHMCRKHYSSAWYDVDAASVQAHMRMTFLGLPIVKQRTVQYGRINPQEANDIFVREALIDRKLTGHYPFFKTNCMQYDNVSVWEAKLRCRDLCIDEATLFTWYKERLPNISSVHDLNKIIKEKGGDSFCTLHSTDLFSRAVTLNPDDYPDFLVFGDKRLILSYQFYPGSPDDGMTISVPCDLVRFIPDYVFTWPCPGMYQQKVEALLATLPKNVRKQCMPLEQTAKDIADSIVFSNTSFENEVATWLVAYGKCTAEECQFNVKDVPVHLHMRIELVDRQGDILAADRDITALKEMAVSLVGISTSPWEKSAKNHEKHSIVRWDFDDIPEHIVLCAQQKGVPVIGYPALTARPQSVDLLVYYTELEAQGHHGDGVNRLIELTLREEWAWLLHELSLPAAMRLQAAPYGDKKISQVLFDSVRRKFLTPDHAAIRTRKEFVHTCDTIKKALKGLGHTLLTVLGETFTRMSECNALLEAQKNPHSMQRIIQAKKMLKAELAFFGSRLTSLLLSYDLFMNYPRYLRCLNFRIQKVFNGDPAKTRAREESFSQFRQVLTNLRTKSPDQTFAHQVMIDTLEMMIEEYCISLYAPQEVKTLFTVSEATINEFIVTIKGNLR